MWRMPVCNMDRVSYIMSSYTSFMNLLSAGLNGHIIAQRFFLLEGELLVTAKNLKHRR